MRWSALGSLALLFGCVSCGGAGASLPDPGPDAGVDPSGMFGAISPQEMDEICDWFAGRLGGYGRERSCGGFNATVPSTQAGCVADLDMGVDCTVGEFESCIDAMIAGPCVAGDVPIGCVDFVSCGLESQGM
jgi:hypothetical protein